MKIDAAMIEQTLDGASGDVAPATLGSAEGVFDRALAGLFAGKKPRETAQRLLRSMVARGLRTLSGSHLVVRDRWGRLDLGAEAPAGGSDWLYGTVNVRDDRFWERIALGGSIGAGEAYAAGWWDSDDPTAVVRIFCRNRDLLARFDATSIAQPLEKARHWLNANTMKGSRKNISAHYDLGNDFFVLFLDETMTYSSAKFTRPEMTLAEAQRAKIDRLLELADVGAGDHLLEIGTGWGALAMRAAERRGCKVTTTTLSEEQLQAARARVRAAALDSRIELLKEDYRALTGTYDKLVSVEMLEAVGTKFYDTFFAKCDALLAPGGKMAIQTITIADQHFERAAKSVDFIQRYIFPGGAIPSLTAIAQSLTRATSLKISVVEDLTDDYAATLKLWREQLKAGAQTARRLGYTDEFLRLWDFYFHYCEGGFRERAIGVVQMLIEKPAWPKAKSEGAAGALGAEGPELTQSGGRA
jgi:cyclopropane-fatty-acyl-phospholipid synthase